jgi:hypothetical protein
MGAIYNGSTNHTADHLTTKNAIIGLLIENNAGSAMTIKKQSKFTILLTLVFFGKQQQL